ncbi:hypothetical protein [Natronobeatus ordinarius]|uniref:hypothetical protein n=1 Tax=Natronobeatus ordinarius TaxID=2963433 RepID=UPI0020CEB592|nr:hypothetical protein [Natronobeatus ordinarius]
MTALHTLQNRIRPGILLVIVAIVGAGTYFEFVYFGPPTLYTVVLWLIVVPMLLTATVSGIRNDPLYQPVMYGVFIAIGVLQYLDGNWFLLAGLLILYGVIGLGFELRNRSDS